MTEETRSGLGNAPYSQQSTAKTAARKAKSVSLPLTPPRTVPVPAAMLFPHRELQILNRNGIKVTV